MSSTTDKILSYNILLIEDNPGDARLIDLYLKDMQNIAFNLEVIDSIKCAKEKLSLKSKKFDIILLDLNLPDSRGLSSFDVINEKSNDIPIIVLTGLDDEETALMAVQKGAQDYLVKDKVESEILKRTIRYAIERKHLAEEKQKLIEQQIRTSAIIEAQENERRRISREIHDGLGQLLSAAKLNFGMLDLIQNADEEKIKETIKQIENLINRAIVESRRISHDLRPATLDDFGLIPSLRIISQDFSKLTGIKVLYQVTNFNDRINPKAEIAIFRIVQEAFNNIMKYSKATEVNLDLFKNDKYVKVMVKDNGIGFNIKDKSLNRNNPNGLGLLNMRERASMAGGKFNIKTSPGKGTEINVEINLDYFK